MKKYLLALVVAALSVYLAMTNFAQSVWVGPLLLTLALFTTIYGLIGLASRNEKCKQVILCLLELIFHWPAI